MKLKNPLAAAAAWAERMSDPANAAPKKRESEPPKKQEAEQPPIPEAQSEPEAAPAPVAPTSAKKPPVSGDELRSAVWAGCIMLGVAGSVVAFFIGMIR